MKKIHKLLTVAAVAGLMPDCLRHKLCTPDTSLKDTAIVTN